MGLAVLDADVLIALLDGDDPHHNDAVEALRECRRVFDDLVLPASVYAEILVRPLQSGATAASKVDAFLERLPASVRSLDQEIARRAASIRARHRRVKLPDALVLATAEHLKADRLITTDGRWPSVRYLGISVRLTVIGAAKAPTASD